MELNIEKGDKYNRLTIIKEVKPNYTKSGRKMRMIMCKCECGTIKNYMLWHLRSGHTKSCGCHKLDIHIKHNKCGSAEYRTWTNMKNRCLNKNERRYNNYGGRGIKLCKRWYDFENFYKDMGKRPKNTTIDRIDNDGNYEPTNCRWATPKEQSNNMRSNVILSHKGKSLTISQWSNKLNIRRSRIAWRISNGWSVEKALTVPPIKRRISDGKRT